MSRAREGASLAIASPLRRLMTAAHAACMRSVHSRLDAGRGGRRPRWPQGVAPATRKREPTRGRGRPRPQGAVRRGQAGPACPPSPRATGAGLPLAGRPGKCVQPPRRAGRKARRAGEGADSPGRACRLTSPHRRRALAWTGRAGSLAQRPAEDDHRAGIGGLGDTERCHPHSRSARRAGARQFQARVPREDGDVGEELEVELKAARKSRPGGRLPSSGIPRGRSA